MGEILVLLGVESGQIAGRAAALKAACVWINSQSVDGTWLPCFYPRLLSIKRFRLNYKQPFILFTT
jgi:hypothetical protein